MSNTTIHKSEAKHRHGLLKSVPLNLQKKWDRHNYDVAEDRVRRNETLSRVNQEAEISDLQDTNLYESGILLTNDDYKPLRINL